MEWIVQWWQQVISNIMSGTIIAQLQWNDWLLIAFLLIGVFLGMKRGFMRMIVEILEALVVILLVMTVHTKVAYFFMVSIQGLSAGIAAPIAFFVTTAVIWIMVSIVDSFLRRLVHTEMFAPLRVVGGAMLGLIHTWLVASLLVQGAYLIPSWNIKKVFESGNSLTGPVLYQTVSQLGEFWEAKITEFEKKKREEKKS